MEAVPEALAASVLEASWLSLVDVGGEADLALGGFRRLCETAALAPLQAEARKVGFGPYLWLRNVRACRILPGRGLESIACFE
ncbi:unnamed protein product [Sphagnum tenellum]